MISAHRTAARARALRAAAALVLALACALALFGCGHEPEIATPPADTGQQKAPSAATQPDPDAQKPSDDTKAEEPKNEEPAKEEEPVPEPKAVHEGPFVISILNAGGADGLAGRAQETLAANGIAAGDAYTISTDSYLAGIVPATIVYVKGTGDDAEAVKAEADKAAEALGGTVETYQDGALQDVTMDGLDILVLVGQDAATV